MHLSAFTEIRATLALATPMVLGLILGTSIGLVDALMVGRGLGTTELAVLGFGVNLTMLLGLAGFGVANSVSILVARVQGRRAPEALAEEMAYPRLGAFIALGFGVAATLGVVLCLHLAHVFNYYGQAPEIIGAGAGYTVAYALAFTATLVAATLRGMFDGRYRPWLPFWLLILTVALNILFNWMFIFGNLGLPALGLFGAGVASLLANLLGVVVLYMCLWRQRLVNHAGARSFRWPMKHFRTLIRMVIPVSIQIAMEGSSFLLAALIMGMLGPVALAAHHVAVQITSVVYMMPMGIGFALAIRVGTAHGTGQMDPVRRIVASALWFLFASALAIALVIAIFRWQLPALFSNDLEVVRLAAGFLIYAAFFQVFDYLQAGAMSILRGMGDVRWPVWVTLVGYWVIGIPLGAVLAFQTSMDGNGIWLGLVVGLLFASVLLNLRVYRRVFLPQGAMAPVLDAGDPAETA